MKMNPLPTCVRALRDLALRPARRRIAAFQVVLVSMSFFAAVAWAANVHRVSQKDRAFNLKTLTVATGDVVQFTNDDEFIHQVYVNSNNFKFDSAESQPGDVINLKFSVPGTFVVQCHIHPKMMLVVTVRDVPASN